MAKSASEQKPTGQPMLETKVTTAQALAKEHRGAYIGPTGPAVEMSQSNFVNPTPTVSPSAPANAPAQADGKKE